MDEKLRLREIQDLKDKEDYDNLPEYVKRFCEKKLEYEKYIDELKYQLNTIKAKNEYMNALKNEGVHCNDTKYDVINFCGVNINFAGGLKKVFYHKIYCNNCVKEIIEEYKKYNEMGLEYV